ncbi:MAG TPA: glycosyltransferase family 2 protein [Candidatus Omnitrophota bacterium]|nr:glycosyltransferase family 2 protein [Candidatus Omnitrophota bacterium]HPD84200.1 glycosyltransferase family 2 protein [Candidatus Omnitrophota bacterium]HRZ03056.1 glycosyltransferase family 2 protein [Candidatus Omnitrophota bacterium]
MNKILISPVAFNENVKLKSVIQRFIQSRVFGQMDYLIIDDGSTDTTSEVIRSFAPQNIGTIKHAQRTGVGAAIRTAITYAIEKGYEVLVIMAGNDKDNPEEIPALVEPIIKEGYDLIQGSRYLRHDGTGGDMPGYRKVAVRVHSFLISLLTHKKITDSTNGFRAIKLSIFKDKRIDINQEWLNTYELEPYLLFKAITLGYKVKEVPVTKIYPAKKLGYTKMKPITGWWSILKPLFYLGLGIKK